MDTISFKGETFIKGSKIAEELGYTADYVGQLCRSGQVEGTLVGRSWYVSEKSIRAHKKNRYRSNQTKSTDAVRKMVEIRTQPKPFYSNQLTTPIYETDDRPLIPSFSKSSPSSIPEAPVVTDEVNEDEVSTVYLNRIVVSPAVKVENRHSDVAKPHSVRPQVHYSGAQTTDLHYRAIPRQIQKKEAVSVNSSQSRVYFRVISSAVIAAGFLLLVTLISFEQHTFASRVMPLDTEYYFDFTGGMQAATALWSAN